MSTQRFALLDDRWLTPPSVTELRHRDRPRRSARTAVAAVGSAVVVGAIAVGSVMFASGGTDLTRPGNGAVPASSRVSASTSGTSSANIDQQAMARLWLLATRAAKANGAVVLSAEAVRSTHAKAVWVTMGDRVEGDQPVWVVQVKGQKPFVCGECSIPPGTSAPTGRYLLLVVGAQTFQQSDFGITSTDAHLNRLGPLVSLHG